MSTKKSKSKSNNVGKDSIHANKVTRVAPNAFAGCKTLKTVTLPSGTTFRPQTNNTAPTTTTNKTIKVKLA
jgi:hypothetical protein